MLAPKISLKQLLLGMVGVAFFLALVSLAYNGSMVAFGLSASILILPILFFGYATVYTILTLSFGSRSKFESNSNHQSDSGQPGKYAPSSKKPAGE